LQMPEMKQSIFVYICIYCCTSSKTDTAVCCC